MKHFLILLMVFSFFQSCSAQSPLNYNELDSKWKKEAMYSLSERYMRYREKHDLERKRYSEIDIFMKFDGIYKFPFGKGIEKLKDEVESRKIVFDSIICLTKQSSLSFDPEYVYPNYYYIFKNDKLIKVLIFEVETSSLIESEDSHSNLQKMFTTSHSMVNGDDQSLLIFTKIKTKWELEISKIVINSYLKF